MIERGWVDHDFIEKHTAGFEHVRELVAKYTPRLTESITGVPAAIVSTGSGREDTILRAGILAPDLALR